MPRPPSPTWSTCRSPSPPASSCRWASCPPSCRRSRPSCPPTTTRSWRGAPSAPGRRHSARVFSGSRGIRPSSSRSPSGPTGERRARSSREGRTSRARGLLGLGGPVGPVFDAERLHLGELLAPGGLLILGPAPLGDLVPFPGGAVEGVLRILALGQRLGDLEREL